jgi:nucleoside-diphosphate-sugar epimerase
MKIAIAGGHGQIALMLARMLRDRGDAARSLIRDPDQSEDVRDAGGEPVVVDLEDSSDGELGAAVTDCDAVVFAAGAGPGSGPERKESVDYGGAVRLIEAARRTGIDRYVMLSSTGADPEAEGDEGMAVYLRAKGRADRELAESGLDFTILRPVRLTDESGTGKVATDGDLMEDSIPREDVAEVLAETLRRDSLIGVTFGVGSGDTLIGEALERLA